MWSVLMVIAGCGGSGEEPAPAAGSAGEKCAHISMEGLPGDWLKVSGSTPDHKTRFRVMEQGGDWSAWYVGGFWKKIPMDGELREKDLKLTEVLRGEELAAWERGERERTRLYVEPYRQRCAMRVMEVGVRRVGGAEEEVQRGGYAEFLPVPEKYTFTYRPCDEPLFLGDAAGDYRKAQQQLKEKGGPDPVTALGEAVPAGMWSDAAEDGDPSCSYTYDVYFDDLPVEGGQGLPAGEVEGGRRHWLHTFYAPYSGNHNFELYRYRSCGGERELLAVACIEGILH